MMSRTHLAAGMAVSMATLSINRPMECAVALAGGALGGVLADVDVLRNDYQHDALIGEAVALGIVGATVIADLFFGQTILHQISANKARAVIGLVMFLALWLWGFTREHRAFTHSIFAQFLYSFSLYMIYPAFGLAGFWGYASHLALDLLNKKGIQLFFPFRRRFCLNLSYSDKTANKVFMYLGFACTLLLLASHLF